MLTSGLTLFTSDSRPKYTNDALNVLALPSGAAYHFRYETRYLPSGARTDFETASPVGTRVLLAFRSEPKVTTEKAVVVPLRWGEITAVDRITDFFVIRFVVKGYPVFRGDSAPQVTDDIQRLAQEYSATKIASEQTLPVHVGLPTFVEMREGAERDAWITVAKSLALHDTFSETHFLRTSPLTTDKGEALTIDANGDYTIYEGHYLHVPVDYFAASYGDHGAAIKVVSDSGTLRIASGGESQLDSRYDSVRVWLQALDVAGQTRSEIQIQTSDRREKAPQTTVRVPIVVHRSPVNMLLRIGLSATGATLVALPGVIGPLADLWLRISLAGIGAVLIAFGVYLVRPGRK